MQPDTAPPAPSAYAGTAPIARGALPDRVGIDEQRDHHLWVVRRRAPPVAPIGGVERLEIQRRHRVEHEPGKMILWQPLAQARRQQQVLLAITRNEVLGHARIVQNQPDGASPFQALPAQLQRVTDSVSQAVLGARSARPGPRAAPSASRIAAGPQRCRRPSRSARARPRQRRPRSSPSSRPPAHRDARRATVSRA
jgi:hypothetical protein